MKLFPGPLPRLDSRSKASVGALLLGACLLFAQGCDSPLKAVKLHVTHRLHPDFQETELVVPGEKFQIGDTEYYGKVVDLVPDFAIDDKTKKVISRSQELRNPAVKIEVYNLGKKIEVDWAFLTDVPHFAPSSQLSFQVDSLIWAPGFEPPLPAEIDSTKAPTTRRDTP